MINRHTKILEILAKRQRVKVLTLAELLEVSQVTVRKDLDHLEKNGLIRRMHGYASIEGSDDMGRLMAHNYSLKRKIAKAAAASVEEGETIMIESGSCCAFLAEELIQSKKDVTIITNSVFIANYVRNKQHTKLILLGGYYLPDSQILVGPMTSQCSEIFFSDKFFVGVDGFMPKFGFTGKDHLRVQTAINLAERASDIIVLTESGKFHYQGGLGVVPFNKVTQVFTDEEIPAETETVLLEKNIALHKVPVNDV
jgi:DeoR/GlpR family transcriptional regulator of sugar metabolism